jgi:peptide/nickel transport system permease protein
MSEDKIPLVAPETAPQRISELHRITKVMFGRWVAIFGTVIILILILVALGTGLLPTYCRLMCGQILSLKENDYVTAARAIGASNRRIMFRHLLPNSFPPLLVLITLNMGSAILMEASLSFLGIGISPPTATWGALISNGYIYTY